MTAKKNNSTTFDVVIIGAGIIGLSCALGLVRQGFSVAVIESGDIKKTLPLSSTPFDIRVVALTRSSEHFFNDLGIWPVIKSTRSCAYQRMQVWDDVQDGLIEFSAVDFLEPNLGHIVEQSVIIGALWQALGQTELCVLMSHQLKDVHYLEDNDNHWLEMVLEPEITLRTSLVIGADGVHSTLRKLCHIQSTGWDYEQSAIVATVEGTLSHQLTAYQRFAADGPLALLPLADPFTTSIVWTTTAKRANRLVNLSEQDFNQTLTRESGGIMGQMRVASRRVIFPLRTHHVKQYAVPRAVLIGDAAHTLHPLAGQGVNLGLLDVVSLLDILVSARKQDRDYGRLRYLQRFERQRRAHNQLMIWAMELFKVGFCSQAGWIQDLRNRGLNWVNRQLVIKKIFAQIALGTLGSFR